MALRKKLLAEFLGTALLLACVVGSGIMGAGKGRTRLLACTRPCRLGCL